MGVLDGFLLSLVFPWNLLFVLGLMLLLAVVFLKARALTLSGAVAAVITGGLTLWCTGFGGLFMLFFFLVSAGVLGLLTKKHRSEGIEKKTGARDASQVFANGFPCLLGAVGWFFTARPLFLLIFTAALAEANADTWAGEIGRLSSKKPVSLKTRRPVEAGISGGVTALGLFGGLLGAVSEAALMCLLFPGERVLTMAALATLCGMLGCVFDSFLGAYAQAQYWDAEHGRLTEIETDSEGRPLELSQGIRWIDNDTVNLMSNLFSCVLATALSLASGL